jgi:glutaredoxin-like protein NrdH
MVTVYTNPSCVQCDMTKKFLDNNEINYKVVDLSQDQASLDMVLGLGFSAAPVVIAGESKWAGFKLDRLKALVV